jgi:uncharacterized protein (TIGR04255 family)
MVTPRAEFKVSDLEPAKDRMATSHPRNAPLVGVSTKVKVEPQKAPDVSQTREHDGFRLETQDQKEVVILAKSWFSYSRLEPYTSWDDVFPRVLRAWDVYKSVATPVQVVRTAVRYINRLPLPMVDNLGEYLTTDPRVPGALPISNWLSSMTVVDHALQVSAIVTQAMELVSSTEMFLLLDHDVFSTEAIQPEDGDAIRALFENLREAKNKLFFDSLTDKAIARLA